VLNILLAEDELEIRELLAEQLRDNGHRVEIAADGQLAIDHLDSHPVDVVICDVRLPKIDGLTILRRIRAAMPATDVIMMTAHVDVAQAVMALKEGACDYLTKPFDVDELLLQVRRIAETRGLRRELEGARGELAAGRGFDAALVGESPAMERVRERITMVARSDASILITGASGTGKEVVARLIHAASARHDEPFIAVNCGALAESLIEAELFGHERGAFTGADRRRDGRFKAADGGTLLLDEVAELPLPAQTKLLRVLQEGTVEPLGSNVPIKVNVRIISATNRNLAARVRTGDFREDLYYRINVIEVPLPALSERRSDLPLLLRHFMQKFTPSGAPLPAISAAAWNAIATHAYPGNIRELSHAIEHAMVLAGDRELDLHHLPAALIGDESQGEREGVGQSSTAVRPLRLAMREFEVAYLQRALAAFDGRRTHAAEVLGISRKTLWEKLRHEGREVRAASAEHA
jgi:two-component system, NtrC family, response regulator AtoC